MLNTRIDYNDTSKVVDSNIEHEDKCPIVI